MNRTTQLLFGPEMVLAAFTAMVFLFCSRHSSHGAEDVGALETLLLLLPFIAVPLAFATIYVPGARTWVWLGRANLALMATLTLCGYRIVTGFGSPGSGPHGQDVGMLLVFSLGIAFSSLANAITAAMILRAQKPAAAEWFRVHRIFGPVLTAVASVPIFAAQTAAASVVVAVLAAVMTVFQR
jgi:hypothetical protein